MWRRLGLGAVVVVCVAACTPTTTVETSVPVRDLTVLSRSEIASANVSDVFDAIARLRPQFFNRRGETSFLLRSRTYVNVYLDNMRLGGVESLRGIPVDGIYAIRYFNAAEATYRWGMNNSGGAIQLVSSPNSARR